MLLVQQGAEQAKKKEKIETDKGELCDLIQMRKTDTIKTKLEDHNDCNTFQLTDPVKMLSSNSKTPKADESIPISDGMDPVN